MRGRFKVDERFGFKPDRPCVIENKAWGDTALREGPTAHERNRTLRQGNCPDCGRAMRLERTGPLTGHAVCERCGGEGYDFNKGGLMWRRLRLEEELKGS